ncbi:MAG: F0F1 ATP synthase subunit delta [bacterium]
MQVLDFSDFFKTSAQAKEFSARLSIISQKIFDTDFNLEQVLSEQLGMHKKDKFIAFLRDRQVNIESTIDLKNFLTKIQEKISFLPEINLTLAFEPNEQTMRTLADWFLLNNKEVVFNINVDPRLIAGVVIYYNSKFIDFSVKSRFDQIIKEAITPPADAAKTQVTNPSEYQ